MSDVFYLRPVAPPITPADVQGMAQHAGGCFDLHGVTWEHSFLSADGGRMLCWYRAPDAESARLALRELGSNMNAVRAGTVTGEGPRSAPLAAANVVAEILGLGLHGGHTAAQPGLESLLLLAMRQARNGRLSRLLSVACARRRSRDHQRRLTHPSMDCSHAAARQGWAFPLNQHLTSY